MVDTLAVGGSAIIGIEAVEKALPDGSDAKLYVQVVIALISIVKMILDHRLKRKAVKNG